MLLIPVIYLRENKVAWPSKRKGVSIVTDPHELASQWVHNGVERVHVVDLDIQPSGISPNEGIIKKIINDLKVDVEVEGAVRTVETVERYLNMGVKLVTLGAVAYQKPDFLAALTKRFPKKIGVHIDVHHGKVTIAGWAVAARKSAVEYAVQFKEAGVDTIFYSDLEEEGPVKAEDIPRVEMFLKGARVPNVIHTADAASLMRLESLLKLEPFGLRGTLLSRSLYDGIIDLAGAITFVKERSASGMDEPTLIPE